ncbi:MAG: hypothetical protein QOI66_2538, partial [Myxococcales bacterium]|nr:hypothetical protein [Myxococcales bacterium]
MRSWPAKTEAMLLHRIQTAARAAGILGGLGAALASALLPGCAVRAPQGSAAAAAAIPIVGIKRAEGPHFVAVAPTAGDGAAKPAGLSALEDELHRAMTELGTQGKPPPYFISYEVHDRTEVVVSASYGAL